MARIITLLILVGLLAGCASAAGSPNPTIDAETTPHSTATPGAGSLNPYAPQPGDEALDRGQVFIDSSEILTLESFPPQFRLALSGNLSTPCHALRIAVPLAADGRIAVEIYSVVDPDKMCAQVLEPFSATVSLDGNPAGQYSVQLNGDKIGDISVPEAGDATAMKGWELYSWQEQGQWVYALLPGTNRYNTLEEAQAPEVRLTDEAALKAALGRLAEGEQVFWMVLDYGDLALPPEAQRQELIDWAAAHGLALQVVVR